MFFFTSKKVQLKIYYLFMLADGNCSSDERAKFSSICKAMDVDSDDENEVIDFCKNAVHISSKDNSAQIIREISKLLVEEGGFLNKDKSKQVEITWNLINLGYADIEYSEAEKKVVSFLTEYWEVDPLTLSDLNDTADTILALTRQKEWVKTTSKTYDVISATIKEIDATIKRMANNVEILISESNIA